MKPQRARRHTAAQQLVRPGKATVLSVLSVPLWSVVSVRRCALALLLFIAVAPALHAAENEFEIGTLMSSFVWRGLRLSDGPVFQASVTMARGGFSLNVWGNMSFREGRVTETDLTFAYARQIRKFTLETGFIHYGIFHDHDSDELYVDVSSDLPLQPEIALYCDVNLGTGAFVQGSVGHSFTLAPRVSLDVRASLGMVFQDGYMGTTDEGREFNGPYSAGIEFSSPIKLRDHWTLNLRTGFTVPLSSNARQAIRNGSVRNPAQGSFHTTLVYGGVTLAYTF